MEVSGQLYTSATIPLGKESLVPSDRRLGRPQCQSVCYGEDERFLTLAGNETSAVHSIIIMKKHFF
jgi:hypothetical protein